MLGATTMVPSVKRVMFIMEDSFWSIAATSGSAKKVMLSLPRVKRVGTSIVKFSIMVSFPEMLRLWTAKSVGTGVVKLSPSKVKRVGTGRVELSIMVSFETWRFLVAKAETWCATNAISATRTFMFR